MPNRQVDARCDTYKGLRHRDHASARLFGHRLHHIGVNPAGWWGDIEPDIATKMLHRRQRAALFARMKRPSFMRPTASFCRTRY